MNTDTTTTAPLLSATKLASKINVSRAVIMTWYHSGLIPAEIAVGKVYRFDEQRVRAVLKEKASPDHNPITTN